MLGYRLRFLYRRWLCDGKHGTTQRSVLRHTNLRGVLADHAGGELPFQRFGTAGRHSALFGRMDLISGTSGENSAIWRIYKAVAVRHLHDNGHSHHGVCRTIRLASTPGSQRDRMS